jgi:hypothetical protein
MMNASFEHNGLTLGEAARYTAEQDPSRVVCRCDTTSLRLADLDVRTKRLANKHFVQGF